MPDESHTEEIFDSELQQLKALQEESEGFLKRRVTLWGIRWTIGFALIWGAVTYEPAWNWLWWAGAGLAVLSLTAILVGRALLNRKCPGRSQNCRSKGSSSSRIGGGRGRDLSGQAKVRPLPSARGS